MRRYMSLVMAGALGLGAVGLTACDREETRRSQNPAADNRTAAEQARDDARTAGDKMGSVLNKMAPSDAAGIYDRISDVTYHALNDNGMDNLIDRFVKFDEDRIQKYANMKHEDLNAKINNLRGDWKATYGHDFKALDKEKAYANWVRIDNLGENTGVAVIPAGHGLGEVRLDFVRESGAWKINVPDSLTGEQLHDGLMKHLDKIEQMKSQWPSDEYEAYRIVTHHVAEALLGK